MKNHYIKRKTSFLSYFPLKQTILCWLFCHRQLTQMYFWPCSPGCCTLTDWPLQTALTGFGWPCPAGRMSSQIGQQKTPGYSLPRSFLGVSCNRLQPQPLTRKPTLCVSSSHWKSTPFPPPDTSALEAVAIFCCC